MASLPYMPKCVGTGGSLAEHPTNVKAAEDAVADFYAGLHQQCRPGVTGEVTVTAKVKDGVIQGHDVGTARHKRASRE